MELTKEYFDKALADQTGRIEKTIEKKVDGLAAMVSRGFEKTDERFDGVDRRLDGVDQRLGRVEFTVSELRDDFQTFEDGEILDLQKRVAVLERTVKHKPAA